MTKQSIEKLKILALIAGVILVAVTALGRPSQEARDSKRAERSQARLLDLMFRICVTQSDEGRNGIPGYKSLRCFYKQNPDGSLALVTDLNMRISIPKPVVEE